MIFSQKALQVMLIAGLSVTLYAAARSADGELAKPDNTLLSVSSEAHEPPSVVSSKQSRGLIDGFELRGDLDDDGEQEIVLALWDEPGGSGVFNYLVILDLVKGKLASQSLFVGDRVQILGGEIVGNTISIDLIEHGDSDPSCCPTQKATRTWAYDSNGHFKEMPVKLRGKLSVEDIGGKEWILNRINEEPVPKGLGISLIYDDGRITGSAGCNSYFADMKDLEGSGGGIKVGPVGSTRKVCPDEIMHMESSYLQKLGNATGFSFIGRQLVVSWNAEGQSGALFFVSGQKLE